MLYNNGQLLVTTTKQGGARKNRLSQMVLLYIAGKFAKHWPIFPRDACVTRVHSAVRAMAPSLCGCLSKVDIVSISLSGSTLLHFA